MTLYTYEAFSLAIVYAAGAILSIAVVRFWSVEPRPVLSVFIAAVWPGVLVLFLGAAAVVAVVMGLCFLLCCVLYRYDGRRGS